MGEQISVPVAFLKELLRWEVESQMEHCFSPESIEACLRDLCQRNGVVKEDEEKFIQLSQVPTREKR